MINTKNASAGFTLVELLVVIVVIGILAAISTVIYGGIQKRAVETTLQSDVTNASKKIEIYAAETGTYPPTLPNDVVASSGNKYEYTSLGTTYCVSASSARNGAQSYYISKGEGIKVGLCSGHQGSKKAGQETASTITWTAGTFQSGNWRNIAYGSNVFVSVGAYQDRVIVSSDGKNWTTYSVPSSSWSDVTYGNGIFVAIASSGSNRVMTSSDGKNWTVNSGLKNSTQYAIAFVKNTFIVNTTSNECKSSNDGLSWGTCASSLVGLRAAAYGNGMYIGLFGYVHSSPDASTWNKSESQPFYGLENIVYGKGYFMITGTDESNVEAVSSKDNGNTWDKQNTPPLYPTYDIAFGNGTFVALSDNKFATGE